MIEFIKQEDTIMPFSSDDLKLWDNIKNKIKESYKGKESKLTQLWDRQKEKFEQKLADYINVTTDYIEKKGMEDEEINEIITQLNIEIETFINEHLWLISTHFWALEKKLNNIVSNEVSAQNKKANDNPFSVFRAAKDFSKTRVRIEEGIENQT